MNNIHHKVAFVDDDKKILESLNSIFMDEPYHVVMCNSALEALNKMENEEFSVVVSDLIMPGMKGDVFLQKVMKRYPNTVCIIMTANSSAAVKQKNVHWVILKPWSIYEIVSSVKKAVNLYESKHAESKRFSE